MNSILHFKDTEEVMLFRDILDSWEDQLADERNIPQAIRQTTERHIEMVHNWRGEILKRLGKELAR